MEVYNGSRYTFIYFEVCIFASLPPHRPTFVFHSVQGADCRMVMGGGCLEKKSKEIERTITIAVIRQRVPKVQVQRVVSPLTIS